MNKLLALFLLGIIVSISAADGKGKAKLKAEKTQIDDSIAKTETKLTTSKTRLADAKAKVDALRAKRNAEQQSLQGDVDKAKKLGITLTGKYAEDVKKAEGAVAERKKKAADSRAELAAYKKAEEDNKAAKAKARAESKAEKDAAASEEGKKSKLEGQKSVLDELRQQLQSKNLNDKQKLKLTEELEAHLGDRMKKLQTAAGKLKDHIAKDKHDDDKAKTLQDKVSKGLGATKARLQKHKDNASKADENRTTLSAAGAKLKAKRENAEETHAKNKAKLDQAKKNRDDKKAKAAKKFLLF